VLFGEGQGDVGAPRQRGELRSGHRRGVDGGG